MTLLIALECNHTMQYVITRERGIIQGKIVILIAQLALARKVIVTRSVRRPHGRQGRAATPASLRRAATLGLGVSPMQHHGRRDRDPPARPGSSPSARELHVLLVDPMTVTALAPPLILIAASPEHSLASVFEGRHYALVQVPTGT